MTTDDSPRTAHVHIRVTPEQKQKLREVADLDEYDSISELLRDRAIRPLAARRDRVVSKAKEAT